MRLCRLKRDASQKHFYLCKEKGNLKDPKQYLKHDYHDDVFFKTVSDLTESIIHLNGRLIHMCSF